MSGVVAYLDSSIVLRACFGEPGAFANWAALEYGVTSRLTVVECLRVLDRRRVRAFLDDPALAGVRAAVLDLLSRLAVVPLSPAVVDAAAAPFPTTLGTLDALHLATALRWQAATGDALVFLTHDEELRVAATAFGLRTTLPGAPV